MSTLQFPSHINFMAMLRWLPAFLLAFSLQAQVSEVTVSVNWPNWSSDNKVDIYDPSGNLIGSICDPVNCQTTTSNSSYSTTLNLGCYTDASNYYIIALDAYGDGWNGTGSSVTVTAGGSTVLTYDLTSGSTSGQQFFNVSGGGSCNSNDVGVEAFTGPGDGCGYSASTAVSVRIRNFGSNSVSNIPVQYRVNGGAITSGGTYTGTIAAGATAVHSFNVNLSTAGTYTFEAQTALGGDPNTSNNATTDYSLYSGTSHDFATGALTMGFESGESLDGWLVLNNNDDNRTWDTESTTNPRTGSQCARYIYNASVAADDYLFTPCLSLATGSNYEVTYYYRVRSASYPEDLEVKLTSAQNASSTVSTLQTYTNLTNTSYLQATHSFTVGSAGTYYIAWHVNSGANEWDLYLDDIEIREVVSDDARISAVEDLPDDCGFTNNENVQVTIENLGTNSISSVPVEYNLDGAGWVSGGTYSGPAIASGATGTMNITVNLSSVGTHNLDVRTALVGDGLPGNDALTGTEMVTLASFDLEASDLTMGFESGDDFTGWTVINNNSDGNTWDPDNTENARTGSEAARYSYNASNAADDWLFSRCIEMYEDRDYELSFYYRVRSATYPEDMTVYLMNDQDVTAVVSTIVSFSNLTNTSYANSTTTINVPSSGTYYLAFQCNSDADMWRLYLDDISLADNTTIWVGNTTDWNTGSNWTNGVPDANTDASIPSSPTGGNMPTLTGTGDVRNFSIASGATMNIGVSGTLNVSGNWLNNGSFDPASGAVNFNGSSAQTISGDNTFYDLQLDNSNGLSVSSGDQSLRGSLDITSGDMDVSGGSFTLISDATATARIGEIPSGSSVTGDITVERYVFGVSAGWHFMSSPVSGATCAQWNDDFLTTGFPDAVIPSYYFTSVFYYDESTVDPDISVGFTAPAASQTMDLTGFWAWIGPAPVTVDVTGPIFQGNQTLNVSYNFSGTPSAADGWNMVANPYPSAIDWAATSGWTKTNINDEIHTFDPATQQYASYIGGVAVNGGSRYIPSSQAFYVKATGTPTLALTEEVKADQDPSFKSVVPFDNLMKVAIVSHNGQRDEAAIRFTSGASDHFDNGYDAHKLFSTNWTVPSLSSVMNDTNDMAVNSLGDLTQPTSIPLRAKTSQPGTFTLNFSGINSFKASTCLILEDLETGVFTNLQTDTSYSFFLSDTAEAPRFLLHFTPGIEVSATDATCNGYTNGSATAIATGTGPWGVSWFDQSGQLIHSDSTTTGIANLLGVSAGQYTVNFATASGSCPVSTEIAVVDQPNELVALFKPDEDTLDLKYGTTVNFLNNSSGANNYYWEFGDGFSSTFAAPTHTYNDPGLYTVDLTISSGVCSANYSDQVLVIDLSTSVEEIELFDLVKVWNAQGVINIDLNLDRRENVSVRLLNALGQEVMPTQNQQVQNDRLEIHPGTIATGIYILDLQIGSEHLQQKLLLNN